MRTTALLLAGAAFFASTAANATFTVYTNQAAFNAATTAPGVDTYTGFSITGSTPSPITRSAGAYTYTAAVSTTSFFGAGTTANPWLSTNTATDSILFNGFTSTVTAIGGNFFGTDIDGAFQLGNVTLTAVDANGASTQTIVNAQVSSFLGFVSTGGLSSLTLTSVQPTSGALWPTVDNLTLARTASVTPVVPEPATWGMMILGFGVAGAAMRRAKVSTSVKFA